MKRCHRLVGLCLLGALSVSLGVWFGGFSLAAMDMSNAAYQMFGSLGSLGFGLLNLGFWLILRPRLIAVDGGSNHAY